MLKFFTKSRRHLSCSHDIETIYLEDKIYDTATDNDDLEDIPTVNKVSYCTKCGKILDIERTSFFEHKPDYSWDAVAKFEQITGIDSKTVTLYKEKRPLKDFRHIYEI